MKTTSHKPTGTGASSADASDFKPQAFPVQVPRPVYVIRDRGETESERYQVELWNPTPGDTPPALADTLAAARAVVPAGLKCFEPTEHDDSSIVEVWL